MAIGALFLACKVEECPRRARDVLNCFCHLCDKRAGKTPAPVDMYSTAFVHLKDKLIRAERELLKELGFILYSEHPHKFILNYVKLLSPSKDKEPALAQAAWNFINDSQRTNVCMKYAPEVICCAAIWFAARSVGIKLPSHTTPPWWELFDAKKEDMDAVCATVTDLYSRPRAHYVKLDPPPETAKPEPPPAPLIADAPPTAETPPTEVAQAFLPQAPAESTAASVQAPASIAAAEPAVAEPVDLGAVPNGDAPNGTPEGRGVGAAPAPTGSPREPSETGLVEPVAALTGAAGDVAQATARSGDTGSEDGECRDGEQRETGPSGSETGDRVRDDDSRRRRRDGDDEREREKRRRRDEYDRRDDRKDERGGHQDRRDRRDFDRRDRRDDRRDRRDYHRR
jgi:hypothetical protein